jgi:hypothetical protein
VSTIADSAEATPKRRNVAGMGVTVIAILVAVGVATLFLTMIGASCTGEPSSPSHESIEDACGYSGTDEPDSEPRRLRSPPPYGRRCLAVAAAVAGEQAERCLPAYR